MSGISQGANAIIADSFASASAVSGGTDIISAASNTDGLWITYAALSRATSAASGRIRIGGVDFVVMEGTNIPDRQIIETTVFVPAGVDVTVFTGGGNPMVGCIAYKLKG